jgi:hypothetical protein
VKVDHRTDIYAFGCIAYRMLTGVPAFEAATALELMMAHVSAPAGAPSTRCPELGSEFDAPILGMLEKDPDDRPQTMEASYELLARAADRASLPGRPSHIPVSPLLRDMVRVAERTVPADVDLSKLRRTHARRPRPTHTGTWLTLAVAGLAVAGVGIMALRAAGTARPSPMAATAAQSASPAPKKRVAMQPPAASASAVKTAEPSLRPATVAIIVRSQPVPADIYYHGQKLGTTPGPVTIPHSDRTQTLILRAPGHAPAQVAVQPTSDLALDVTLVPLARRPKPVGVSRDLENPY